MIGSFGKAKGGGAKPLKSLTYKQLDKRQEALQALVTAGTATTKQTKNLAKATSILATRDARYAARHPTQEQAPPANGAKPIMPTTAPSSGYQWVYDAVGNQYVQQQIPVTQQPPAGSYYSGGGGGGGGAPDFSPYAYDPSTGGGPGLGPATDATVEKSGLQAALESGTSSPMSTTTKVVLGVAVAAGAFYFFKKRRGARGA